MLKLNDTRIVTSFPAPIHPTFPINAEGMALNAVILGNRRVVLPSVGSANTETFAGFSLMENIRPGEQTIVENFTVAAAPGPYTFTLRRAPMAGTLFVKANGSTVITAVVGAPAAGQYSITGQVLTFNTAQAGATIYVVYRYVLTVTEAQTLFGDQPVGGITAAARTGVMTVIERGDVATDQFDTTIDWAAVTGATPLRAGANGRVTTAGSGAIIPGYVISVPTADVPFLVLRVN